MEARQYRGRRVFQTFVALIGAAIIALAIADLNRAPEQRGSLAPGTPQPVQDVTDFLDNEIGYLPIDFLMLAFGGWVVFFGLHGALLNGPQLYFDRNGIGYFRFGYQIIPWDAIQQIRVLERRRMALLRGGAIELELKDPAPFARRQPYAYRLFRRTQHIFDPKTFSIQGYDIEVPIVLVAKEMQQLVEPESMAPPADDPGAGGGPTASNA